MSLEFTREAVIKFLPVQFPCIDVDVDLRSKIHPLKDFQLSDQTQRSSRKIFTAHYACRNADS